MDKKINVRHIIQLIATLITNSNIKGFWEGKIYTGKTKTLCVPGLNCYSCPGALGACPIGSLQAVIGSFKYNFSLYVTGFLGLIGITLGRFVCGFLCPFGFIQDLLNKIPSPKIKIREKINGVLKYLKYIILVVFVILLPIVMQDELGISDPYFCKYICPSGTLSGGIPLLLKNESLRGAIGFLFNWKLTILIIIVILSVIIYRPFCRYLCPLGAIYAVLNPISFLKLKVDESKCNGCKACSRKCKMDIKVYKTPNSPECIRCGECRKVCKNNAISYNLNLKLDKVNTMEGNKLH